MFSYGKEASFFLPFLYFIPLIYLYVPLHFPISFIIILILSVLPYLTFILTIFLTLTPSSFPLPASLFPSFLQPSFRSSQQPLVFPHPYYHFLSFSLSLLCLSLPLRCQITVYSSACPVITFFTQTHPLIGPVSSYHIMQNI